MLFPEQEAELLGQERVHVRAAVDDGAAEKGGRGAREDESDDEGGKGDGVGVVECLDPGKRLAGRRGRPGRTPTSTARSRHHTLC